MSIDKNSMVIDFYSNMKFAKGQQGSFVPSNYHVPTDASTNQELVLHEFEVGKEYTFNEDGEITFPCNRKRDSEKLPNIWPHPPEETSIQKPIKDLYFFVCGTMTLYLSGGILGDKKYKCVLENLSLGQGDQHNTWNRWYWGHKSICKSKDTDNFEFYIKFDKVTDENGAIVEPFWMGVWRHYSYTFWCTPIPEMRVDYLYDQSRFAMATAGYYVQTQTGFSTYAGTDAGIFVTLEGERGILPERELTPLIGNDQREKGSTDLSLIGVGMRSKVQDVGKIFRMTIRSDNKIAAAGWELMAVHIRRQTFHLMPTFSKDQLETDVYPAYCDFQCDPKRAKFIESYDNFDLTNTVSHFYFGDERGGYTQWVGGSKKNPLKFTKEVEHKIWGIPRVVSELSKVGDIEPVPENIITVPGNSPKEFTLETDYDSNYSMLYIQAALIPNTMMSKFLNSTSFAELNELFDGLKQCHVYLPYIQYLFEEPLNDKNVERLITYGVDASKREQIKVKFAENIQCEKAEEEIKKLGITKRKVSTTILNTQRDEARFQVKLQKEALSAFIISNSLVLKVHGTFGIGIQGYNQLP